LRKRLQKVDDFWQRIDKIMSRLSKLDRRDLTFVEFLRQRCSGKSLQTERNYALAFVEGFDAAPADRISAKALAKMQEGSDEDDFRSLRILSGYDRVIEHMRRQSDQRNGSIELQTIVKSIHWNRRGVEIRSNGKMWRVRRCIITLPLGVLQALPGERGAIQFDPPLPEKIDAARQLAMGAVVKILVQFKSAYWEESKLNLDRMAFMHARNMPFATWWCMYPVRSTILVGWAGGPSSDTLVGRSKTEIARQATKSLSHLLGMSAARIESKIENLWICDWKSDPFARGAYSYVPVGALAAVKKLANPVDRVLYFAGEATDYEGLGGTVDAAIKTGRRAAREILSYQ
jgi:monoamine oxidase